MKETAEFISVSSRKKKKNQLLKIRSFAVGICESVNRPSREGLNQTLKALLTVVNSQQGFPFNSEIF